jgi:hypothetical protein
MTTTKSELAAHCRALSKRYGATVYDLDNDRVLTWDQAVVRQLRDIDRVPDLPATGALADPSPLLVPVAKAFKTRRPIWLLMLINIKRRGDHYVGFCPKCGTWSTLRPNQAYNRLICDKCDAKVTVNRCQCGLWIAGTRKLTLSKDEIWVPKGKGGKGEYRKVKICPECRKVVKRRHRLPIPPTEQCLKATGDLGLVEDKRTGADVLRGDWTRPTSRRPTVEDYKTEDIKRAGNYLAAEEFEEGLG